MHDDSILQSASVLIADDDPAMLHLLTHLLEQAGHQVRTAQDGNTCLQQILHECPDVLIADWSMPGLGGLELCRRVRKLHQRKVLLHYTYIVLLTTQTGKRHYIEGLEAGADDFVEKNAESLADFRVEISARLRAALRTRKLESELEQSAKYDALTQLLNRVTFFEQATVFWERSIKNKYPLSVVMFDCDFFKRINDIHGHTVGDAVLREMAAILRDFSRPLDLICRYGGEEFCVILPGSNEKTAWNWAERMRRQFETTPIKYNHTEIGITVSFGIAERMDDTINFDQLFVRADQALLFAKAAGRNRCIRYSETVASETNKVSAAADLFTGVIAGDIMMPLTLSIGPDETVSSVVDFFLKTRIEALPVVDRNNHLIGMISEKSFVPLIGNVNRWSGAINDLISKSVISYPIDTPLQVIYDFLCRVSANQILIIQNDVPVGYINRTPLLRWARNQWALKSGCFDAIIPNMSLQDIPLDNLQSSVEVLQKSLSELNHWLNDHSHTELHDNERNRLVFLISQSQDIMDQVLKYSAKQMQGNAGQLFS